MQQTIPALKKISLKERMSSIGHKLLVLSGKGGVGKSTFSVQLALALVLRGYRVGVLDIDICGPSIPKLLGIEGHNIYQCSSGWLPIYVTKDKLLSCMSIGFLLKSPDDAVVWRGPRKDAMIRQFLQDVYWGPLDILIIDTPPGTSDEHITISETLKSTGLDGSVIVTTPQEVSLSDVRKEINFCKKLNVNILGIVENLSGFACPCCSEVTYIFSKGGGEKLSQKFNIPFLGSIPIDPYLSQNGDMGDADFLEKHQDRVAAKQLNDIVTKLISEQLNLPLELSEVEKQIRIETALKEASLLLSLQQQQQQQQQEQTSKQNEEEQSEDSQQSINDSQSPENNIVSGSPINQSKSPSPANSPKP